MKTLQLLFTFMLLSFGSLGFALENVGGATQGPGGGGTYYCGPTCSVSSLNLSGCYSDYGTCCAVNNCGGSGTVTKYCASHSPVCSAGTYSSSGPFPTTCYNSQSTCCNNHSCAYQADPSSGLTSADPNISVANPTNNTPALMQIAYVKFVCKNDAKNGIAPRTYYPEATNNPLQICRTTVNGQNPGGFLAWSITQPTPMQEDFSAYDPNFEVSGGPSTGNGGTTTGSGVSGTGTSGTTGTSGSGTSVPSNESMYEAE